MHLKTDVDLKKKATHQVGMKNVVKCYKDFFGYFNALKTHCVFFMQNKRNVIELNLLFVTRETKEGLVKGYYFFKKKGFNSKEHLILNYTIQVTIFNSLAQKKKG